MRNLVYQFQLAVRTMSMVGTLRYLQLKKTKMRKLLMFCPFIQKNEKTLFIERCLQRKIHLNPLTDPFQKEINLEDLHVLQLWKKQFVDALTLESPESRKLNNAHLRIARILWQSLIVPWRLLFAFVPPYQISHGWITFICSLLFISGIAYTVTELTDIISCVTVINAYVIAFTALAAGTSWPDLVASKIAAERQLTADSAIANITCSNSVNIYVGIGIPWLINTAYNFITYGEPLRIENAEGLGFTLMVFFSTSVGCISVLVVRRLILGAELGGPRFWAWVTSVFFMLLWLIFVVLSSSFWHHII